VILFEECRNNFTEAQLTTINDSIVHCLLKFGIGVPQSIGPMKGVRSMFDVPILHELHAAAMNKPQWLDIQLADYTSWKNGGEVGFPPTIDLVGLVVMSDLRIVASHHPDFVSDLLVKQGWSLELLETIATTVRDCVLNMRSAKLPFTVTRSGKLKLPSKLLKRNKKRAHLQTL
jgi:hypothetical protein